MRNERAAGLIDGIHALAEQRPDWIAPYEVSIEVRRDLTGTVTRRCRLDEDNLIDVWDGASRQSGQPEVLLPVCKVSEDDLPGSYEVSIAHVRSTDVLRSFSCDELTLAIDDRSSLPVLERELVAVVDREHLSNAMSLSVTAPLHVEQDISNPNSAGWRRLIDFFQPVGLVDVVVPNDVDASRLEMVLPSDIAVDHAVLTIGNDLEPVLNRLRRLVEGLTKRPESGWLEVPYSRHLLGRIRSLVGELRKVVEARAARLDATPQDPDDAEPHWSSFSARARLATTRRALDELADAIDKHLSAEPLNLTPEILVGLASKAIAIGEAAATSRVACTASRVSLGTEDLHIFEHPLLPDVTGATLVYSPSRTDMRRLHPGARASLVFVGLILLLLSARLGVDQLLPGSHPLSDAAQEDLDNSRESLVAVLVVFPALLYARLERLGVEQRMFDRATGVALGTVGLATLAPVLIAVMAIGHLHPQLLVRACAVVGVLMLLVAAVFSRSMNPLVVMRMRRRLCERELRA